MKRFFVFAFLMSCLLQTGFAQSRIFLFDNFAQGLVFFHSGAKGGGLMNYDANSGKMYFMQDGTLMEMTNAQYADSVKFGDRKFIMKNGDFVERFNCEHGVIDIKWRIHKIHEGYVGAMGTVSQVGAKKIQLPSNFGMGTFTANGGGGMYNGSFGVNDNSEGGRNLDVWRQKNDNTYFFAKNGREYKVKRTKDVLKAFPEHEKEIKEFLHTNNLDMIQADNAMRIIDYILSL